MNEPIEIPNKSSFKINEVCALTGIKSYVLRFWESEFSEIAPLMSSSGQKLYEHRDIEAILLIKKLLFEDKLTIEKARAEMKLLMPREHLVEPGFNEFEEESPVQQKAVNIAGLNATANACQTKRVLIESDVQKLVTAKIKLKQIISLAEAVQKKHHWR